MATDSGAYWGARPDRLLRLEGLMELVVCCVAYNYLSSGRWGLFALLFLVPDVSLAAYALPDKRIAAALYNLLHNAAIPLLLGLFAWMHGGRMYGEVALIWLAHISFDRSVGYGLKFPGDFKRTHIQVSSSL